MKTTTTNYIKIQNKITGLYYANGSFAANFAEAELIEENSPSFFVIKHTFDFTHSYIIPCHANGDAYTPQFTKGQEVIINHPTWTHPSKYIVKKIYKNGSVSFAPITGSKVFKLTTKTDCDFVFTTI